MNQEFIDKLYFISIMDNNIEFKNNIKLFREFYSQILSYRKIDEKIYSVMKMILKNYKLMDNEYCVSEILDILLFYQEKICFKITQSKDTSLEDLDLILKELKQYEIIKDMVSEYYYTENIINKFSINKYCNSEIYVYYIDALTKILSNNYLIISKDKSDEIMNLIYNNGWLNNLMNGKIKNSMLNRDLILKYVQRILTIKEFVSDEELSEDKLVSSIINCKIKDKKLLENLFNYLSPLKLISIFDYDVKKLFDFVLNIDYLDDYYKFTLLYKFVYKCLDEDNYDWLFDILKSDIINNSLVSKIFDDEIKQKIIKFALNDSIKEKSSVYYLLDNDVFDYNLICNSMMMYGDDDRIKLELLKTGFLKEDDYQVLIDKKDLDLVKLQKIKKYNLTGRIIDCDIVIDLLDKYFNGEIKLSLESVKGIVRGIICGYLNKNGISDVKVLFNNVDRANGSFVEIERGKYISINIRQIEKFLDPKVKLENRFDLFITMFHEMRHAIKSDNIKNNIFDYNTYFMLKEKIIRNYDLNYYSSNYRMILEEIDARSDSYLEVHNFFKENFPMFESIIGSMIETKIENYDYREYNEKKFSITDRKEYVSLIFDKIISMRPELIERYPVLQLEYNLDGSVKDRDDIYDNGNYDIELIDKIIMYRYGNNLKSVRK